MKKLLIIAFSALASLSASAQLFWKVQGNGAHGVSYLFGTHHVAPISVIDSISGLAPAICSVDAVAGELDMSQITDPVAAQAAVMKHAMAPADSTLTKVLSAAQLDSLNAVLGKYTGGQLQAAMLDPLKPSMVNTQLAMFQSMVAFPEFNQTDQLDSEVQKRARECSREIIALETVEQQMQLLFGGDIMEQAEDLMSSVRHDDEAADKALQLAAAYRLGNLDEILKLLIDENDGLDGEALDKLLLARNNAWIDKLSELLPRKSVLVCVGVGHLVGPKGLIARLRDLGYEVTPAE